jgi:hypothetical protein
VTGQRYPLIANGDGWSELPVDARPADHGLTEFEAYRVDCRDRTCPFLISVLGVHSHIEETKREATK